MFSLMFSVWALSAPMQSMVINTMIQILLFSAAITEAPQPNVFPIM